MNIKNISLSVLAIMAVALFSFTVPEEKIVTYSIDLDRSSLEWLGKKVTGQHNGNIALSSGALIVEDNEITGGTFTIDMTSITNEDIKDQEYNQKLVGHLKSDDFFGVKKYPEATFKITEVEENEGEKFDITGDLTIKGITHQISFPADITVGKKEVVANAKIIVDRSKYDVRYGSGSFFDDLGDKTIYDDFEMDISLVAIK